MKPKYLSLAALALSASLGVVPASADATTWHGFYAGVHGSYISVETDYTNPSTPSQGMDGALLGVQAGYNFALGSNWVLGIEGDLSFGKLNDFIRDGNFLTEDGEIRTAGTLRARLGIAMEGGWMSYVTGGLAWDRMEQGSTCPAAAPFGICAATGAFDVRSTEGYTGWVAGGGVEFALSPRWSMKGEGMLGDFGEATYTGTVPVFGTSSTKVEQDLNSLFQVGVNYHF